MATDSKFKFTLFNRKPEFHLRAAIKGICSLNCSFLCDGAVLLVPQLQSRGGQRKGFWLKRCCRWTQTTFWETSSITSESDHAAVVIKVHMWPPELSPRTTVTTLSLKQPQQRVSSEPHLTLGFVGLSRSSPPSREKPLEPHIKHTQACLWKFHLSSVLQLQGLACLL